MDKRKQPHSEEHRKKIGAAQKGKSKPSLIGHIVSEETRKKISEKNKGKSRNLGRVVSKETRDKISKANIGHFARKGKDSNFWKGGNSELYKNERYRLMATSKYKIWRRGVFERDNYRCTNCNDDVGGNLNAHHIKSWKDYPELRFALDNGMTLCKKCHILEHSKLIKNK